MQARPITTLYPALSGLPDDGQLRVLISFGAVQGILEPITPPGRDIFCSLAAAIATLLFEPTADEAQQALFEAGERLFINITPLLRHPTGRRVMREIFPLIEPGSVETLERLLADPRLALRTGKGRPSGRTVRALAPMLRNVRQEGRPFPSRSARRGSANNRSNVSIEPGSMRGKTLRMARRPKGWRRTGVMLMNSRPPASKSARLPNGWISLIGYQAKGYSIVPVY